MMVTTGVPRASFTVTDTERKRTGRDTLSLSGEVNSTHLAAALRGLHLYLTQPDQATSGCVRYRCRPRRAAARCVLLTSPERERVSRPVRFRSVSVTVKEARGTPVVTIMSTAVLA